MSSTGKGTAYRPPKATIVVLGEVSDTVLERLSLIVRTHGPKGVRIIVINNKLSKDIEALRKVLLNNHAFTIELYTLYPEEARMLRLDTLSAASILVSNPELINLVPDEIKKVAEVL